MDLTFGSPPEAAHIQPYHENGLHVVANGLLLRSDLHKLFDDGYITIADDMRIEVSRRIREELENGRGYYELAGQKFQVLPAPVVEQPGPPFLEWLHSARYLG